MSNYPDQLPDAVQALVDQEAELRVQFRRAQAAEVAARKAAKEAPLQYERAVREAIERATDPAKAKRPDLDALALQAQACARAEADLKRDLKNIAWQIGDAVIGCWDECVALTDPPIEQATARLAELEAQTEQTRGELRRLLLARRWLSGYQFPRQSNGMVFNAATRGTGWTGAWQPTSQSLAEVRKSEARDKALWENEQLGQRQAAQRLAEYEAAQARQAGGVR